MTARNGRSNRVNASAWTMRKSGRMRCFGFMMQGARQSRRGGDRRWVMRVLALMCSLALVARAEPPSGSEEIAQLVAERHYPQALQKISTALVLKGPAAKAVDRHQLYMLKAECHLQQRAAGMAQEAYANAIKAAGDDGEKVAIARAHEM